MKYRLKSLISTVSALLFTLSLAACAGASQEQAKTFDFKGEHEYFTVSNVTVVIDGDKQEFNAGKLTVKEPGVFESVRSYSACFYTLKNGERDVFYLTTATYSESDSFPTVQNFGTASSDGVTMSRLAESLWFELKTVDGDGTENVYQVQLA